MLCHAHLKSRRSTRHSKRVPPLTTLLDREAIECLALNVQYAHPVFDVDGFISAAMDGLGPLKVMERGRHIAQVLQHFLPTKYADAIKASIGSMAAELTSADEEFGMAPFFYMPVVFLLLILVSIKNIMMEKILNIPMKWFMN